MGYPFREYTATSPELTTAVSILINDYKLGGLIDVVDRGAVSGVIEFTVDALDKPPTERMLRAFKATMKENGFTVLEASWQKYLSVKIQRQAK